MSEHMSSLIHKLSFNEILERVKQVIESEGTGDIAKALNAKSNNVINWKTRGTIPLENLLQFTKDQSVSLRWLLTGDETPEVDFSLIPKFEAVLSGGPGSQQLSQEIKSMYAFRTDWLKSKGPRKNLALFAVAGDSMAPTIRDGDTILVDRSQNIPREALSGKIYAIGEGTLAKVKRLQWQGEELWVLSDNKTEGELDYRVQKFSKFFVIGRVIWVGHEVK